MNNNNHKRHSQKLSIEDEDLILKCKEEQLSLLRQAAQFSNRSLAVKFDVCQSTICRVSERYRGE